MCILKNLTGLCLIKQKKIKNTSARVFYRVLVVKVH